MRWFTPNPWVRKTVAIDCQDAADAAASGDEDAILLDDEMRRLNLGGVYVFARPGDNIWKLALKELENFNGDWRIPPRISCLDHSMWGVGNA